MNIIAIQFFYIKWLCLLLMQACINRLKYFKRLRRWWVQPHLYENLRAEYGAYASIFMYFKLHNHEEFRNFVGMSVAQFNEIHELVKDKLAKRSNRKPLSSELRLAAVLNFLVHGKNVTQHSWFFRIGRSTMYKLIPEVCTALYDSLNTNYLNFPTRDDWQDIANGFLQKYDFPNCTGAIDGKHCRIKRPVNAGSWFFNFKKFHSIVLMASCDAHYRFTWAAVGDFGSWNDAGIFSNCNLGQALEANEVELPENQMLPRSDIECPFFFIGDGGFPLKRYLIKPFQRTRNMRVDQKIFNHRLSHARKVIECSFGILCKKWKLFESPLDFQLKTSQIVIMSILCLHNFLIDQDMNAPAGDGRYGNINNDAFEGEESDSDHDMNEENEPVYENTNENEDNGNNENRDDENYENGDDENNEVGQHQDFQGIRIREILTEYFISAAGNVRWQWDKL